jgi:uncharacterized protein (TIGR00725 family)
MTVDPTPTEAATQRYAAVVGPARATAEQVASARALGRGLAERGVVVLTGGHGGVMAAAASGVAEAAGTSIAVLPGMDRSEADPAHTFALPTGLGELRNGLLVRCADVVVAVGCSWGTLSEVALAVRAGVPVVTLDCWDLPDGGPQAATSVPDALAHLDRLLADPLRR